MPKAEPLTVYVDLLNVEEVQSLMQDAATEIAALRAAAWALLDHDTEENRARLSALVHPDQWAAECAEFGCHEAT